MTDRLNIKLWLDDERPAPEGWTWAKTANEAIHWLVLPGLVGHGSLNVGSPNFMTLTHMSFDHDLADVHYDYWYVGHMDDGKVPRNHPMRVEARERAAKEMTGYDVLLWMAEYGVWPTEACYVHTANAAAQKKMCGVIDRYGPYDQPVRWTPALK